MTVELMVYALIAAGLVFWLRSILGTRDEDDVQRPPLNLEIDEKGKIVGIDSGDNTGNAVALIEELAQNPKGNMAIAASHVEQGLIDITKSDSKFNVYDFLQAAQDAFVFVVESFAEGDRETLQDLLGTEVYESFEGAIIAREKAGETMNTEIHAITSSEILEARVEGKNAFVTVRFLASETSVIKDEEGTIISGHPDQTTQMRDVWTFSHVLKSRDPRWLVVETRDDGVEDNDIIPNTH